jgi:hypothetical protein
VEGLNIYPLVLFKDALKDFIKIHKNFIDPNAKSLKIILKIFNTGLVSKSSTSASQICEQNSICIYCVEVELHFKSLVYLKKGI